jgi:hypothetical protein
LRGATTCLSSLNNSGFSISKNNTTINGALYLNGFIIGSGSGLTNLIYNSIYNPSS